MQRQDHLGSEIGEYRFVLVRLTNWDKCRVTAVSVNYLTQWKSSCDAGQEIPGILWNRKVHFRVYYSPLFVRRLSQITPAHFLAGSFIQLHFNTTHPSKPRSSKSSVSQRSPHQTMVYISPLPHTCHTLGSTHPP